MNQPRSVAGSEWQVKFRLCPCARRVFARIRAEQIDGDGNVTMLAETPPEYGDESEIEFEVTPGSNTFDLDVSTQAAG